MSFTGRRPNDRLRSIGRGLLEGLDSLGTAMNDAPKRERIREIDATIIELKQERDHLVHGLYEPGDYTVSEDYNPNWTPKPAVASGDGRLTKCGGQISSSDHFNVHPGCPYKGSRHNSHEFTLRD